MLLEYSTNWTPHCADGVGILDPYVSFLVKRDKFVKAKQSASKLRLLLLLLNQYPVS